MATTKQLGRPGHSPEMVLQSGVQVQAASNAAVADQALIDLGGDYAGAPGSLSARLDEYDARLTALEP